MSRNRACTMVAQRPSTCVVRVSPARLFSRHACRSLQYLEQLSCQRPREEITISLAHPRPVRPDSCPLYSVSVSRSATISHTPYSRRSTHTSRDFFDRPRGPICQWRSSCTRQRTDRTCFDKPRDTVPYQQAQIYRNSKTEVRTSTETKQL